MKALDVFNLAMGLLDEISSNGTIPDGTTKEYKARTPSLLSMLQYELAVKEGKTSSILTSIDDELVVSDGTAINILPFGLAYLLLLEENNDLSMQYLDEYNKRKRKIPLSPVKIIDVYNVGGEV